MKVGKRKALWGILGLVLGVGAFGVVLLSLSINRTGRQYRAFEKQFAGAGERAARIAVQMNDQLSAGGARPSRAAREQNRAPARAGAPATTQTLFAREFDGIQQEWMDLVRAAERRDYRIYPPFLLEQGIGGVTITFDAGEFPEEEIKGGLRGGAALRERIRQEAGKMLNNDARRSTRYSATANALSSGPLAEKMNQILDRTGRLLLNNAVAPDPARDTALYTYHNFEMISSAAVLRAGLRGQRAEAGRMLERLLRVQLQARVNLFPHPGNFWMTQKTLLLLAEEGQLEDAALARLEALLRRARFDDRQLADLRAAYVLRMNHDFETIGDQGYHDGLSAGHPRVMLFFETQTERVAAAVLLAALRPVMMSWARGDEAAYDRALRHPINVTSMIYLRFPLELAAFSRDSSANDAVDQTRLVVAAARWRMARGHWPERIGDLVPRYLDAGFISGPESFYAIDRIETPAGNGENGGPKEPAISRPIFYYARRLPLTPLRLTAVQYGGGQFPVSNQVRSFDAPDDHSLWGWLGLRGERQMLGQMTSDRRVEGIVVRAVWPNPEPLATGWVRNMNVERAQP